ncbi:MULTISPECIES: helix-turn-helix domain-containing protein [Clostridium]|jgi:DNA invertase Pin-like site-specific DNA recombinase|uniref:helix-turn-helix domain-containing protein n=1 Tax=Clostridium TaxID=1485 RepID=UPI0003B4159E|nr:MULTISPECIES: helix-turn-helix transcriptional regulator [Clostridium]MDY4607279.1 helix-turn-helix transcriptional regulator [Clostridium tertium]
MKFFSDSKDKLKVDWKEKYMELEEKYEKIYDENRVLLKKVELLEKRIKKTGYLEPKKRQITFDQILQIKALRKNEGMSYSSIAKETGWSKGTISRVLNGQYD